MSVLCLVPSPLRAARASRRLCDAGRGILFDARVTTFDALAPGLLASAGDRRPVLSALAEALLALEAGEVAGGPFSAASPGSGLAAALACALRELRLGEVAPADVRAAAGELGGSAAERLSRLASALEAYQERLASLEALDRAACLRAVADAVGRGAAVEEARDLDLLVVDGFDALPPAALDVLWALAHRARRVLVRVPFFPERPDVCGPAEPLLRRLEGLHGLAATREVTIALEDVDEGRAPRLARVLRAVAGGPGGGRDGEEGVVLAAAGAGEDGEAEAAAGAMARLLDRGLPPEEVLAFAPFPARAAPKLARACAALGVPFAGGRGALLSDLPPVRAAQDALRAAARPGRAALEEVFHSPYLGLDRGPAALGRWLDRAGALEGRGEPEEALRRRASLLRSEGASAERVACLRAADALDRARAALRPLGSSGRPRDHAARCRALLSGPDARRRAARGEPALARRDLAALARLEEVADDLARALGVLGHGEEVLAAERWSELLALALGSATLPPSLEPAAGAIELWPLSEAPGLAARGAVVTGCGQGRFPPPTAPEPLLRDAERAALNRRARRAAVAPASLARTRALHAAFSALAAGREALAITWPGPGPEGPGAGPASLAAEALLVAGEAITTAPAREPPPSLRRSAAQALRSAARAFAEGGDSSAALLAIPDGPLGGRLASALARGALEAERRRAVLARRSSPAAGALPPELADELRGVLPEEWSPSQLESHARCPYRLFAGLALGLRDPDAADLDIDPRDEGSLTHAILERFLRRRVARGAVPLRGGPEEGQELRAAAAEVFARYEADGCTGDAATWPGRRAAILARLARVIAAEARWAADGLGVVPALLEYRFGGDSGVPALTFAAGGEGEPGEVRLRGRIDRVDASPERIVVVDYKDSRARGEWRKKLDRAALGETNFQVPAYLMAAARALPGRLALEATYVLLRSAERVEPFSAERGDGLLATGEADRAAARAAGSVPFADAVVAAVRRIRAGDLPIASRDCTGCAFGAVCRSQSLAEAPP